MRTKASQEGYLLVDHRASPGLPPELARALGYDPAQVAEGKMLEAATLTCAHCKAVVVPNHLRVRERAACPKCNYHYVCDWCAAAMDAPDYTHLPFDKLVDDTLDAAARGVQLGSPRVLLDTATPPALVIPPDSKG